MKRLLLIMIGLSGLACAQTHSQVARTEVEIRPMTPEVRFYLTAVDDIDLDKSIMLQRSAEHVNLMARHADGQGLRFVTVTTREAERLLGRQFIGKAAKVMDIYTDEEIVLTGNTLELSGATIRAVNFQNGDGR